MKDLLLSIRTRLRTIEGLRASDVFLSADKNLVPPGTRYPAVGIKDGRMQRKFLLGGVTEMILPVEIHIYEELGDDDRAIISVFDLTGMVHDLLSEDYFEGYVKDVEPGEETPVELLYRKDGMILRKTLFYQYEREN